MQLKRWKSFSKNQQFLMIGSEIMRARVWQGKDEEKFRAALERTFELIDLSLEDAQWRGRFYMLLWLRREVSRFYQGEIAYNMEVLYGAL